MKKMLIPVILLLTGGWAHGQNFEGTVKWSMQMEITDPAVKAKMEEAKKKMSDPAEQAKMKEMQAKMNDPQMKAMLDANPAMKAQMENAMKMMQSGDINAMMPKGIVIKIKDKNILTTMEGGPVSMEMLYLNSNDMAYRIDKGSKTFSKMNPTANPQQQQAPNQPKVTKTTETKKILNYNCTKYLVEIQEGTHTINETIWATTEIKDIDVKGFMKQRMGRGQNLIVAGVDGFPLRVEATTPEGNMVMEVSEIKKESLPASDFVIPSDYKEAPAGMLGKY